MKLLGIEIAQGPNVMPPSRRFLVAFPVMLLGLSLLKTNTLSSMGVSLSTLAGVLVIIPNLVTTNEHLKSFFFSRSERQGIEAALNDGYTIVMPMLIWVLYVLLGVGAVLRIFNNIYLIIIISVIWVGFSSFIIIAMHSMFDFIDVKYNEVANKVDMDATGELASNYLYLWGTVIFLIGQSMQIIAG